jgi:hypothetical protein
MMLIINNIIKHLKKNVKLRKELQSGKFSLTGIEKIREIITISLKKSLFVK